VFNLTIVSSDLVHDSSMGEDVQDPGQGFRAVPATGDGPGDEGCLPETRGRNT